MYWLCLHVLHIYNVSYNQERSVTVCNFHAVWSSLITSLSRDLTALFSIQAEMPLTWFTIYPCCNRRCSAPLRDDPRRSPWCPWYSVIPVILCDSEWCAVIHCDALRWSVFVWQPTYPWQWCDTAWAPWQHSTASVPCLSMICFAPWGGVIDSMMFMMFRDAPWQDAMP